MCKFIPEGSQAILESSNIKVALNYIVESRDEVLSLRMNDVW